MSERRRFLVDTPLDRDPPDHRSPGLARSQGLTIQATDLLIAACAEHHGLGLVHADGHFDRLAELRNR